MPTVAFHTLGCKVNQYDSQAMLELFLADGFEAVSFQMCLPHLRGALDVAHVVVVARFPGPQEDFVHEGRIG